VVDFQSGRNLFWRKSCKNRPFLTKIVRPRMSKHTFLDKNHVLQYVKADLFGQKGMFWHTGAHDFCQKRSVFTGFSPKKVTARLKINHLLSCRPSIDLASI
jgi:hypothetical protein